MDTQHNEGKPEHEGGELDKTNPNYIHNLFMRNAYVWTDEHQWMMRIDRFKEVMKDFEPSTPPTPVSRTAEEVNNAILDLIDKARTYNDGWVFTSEELISEFQKAMELIGTQPEEREEREERVSKK